MILQIDTKTYLHTAYAENADGTDGFTLTDVGTFVGHYTDHNATESEDPASYTWTVYDPDAVTEETTQAVDETLAREVRENRDTVKRMQEASGQSIGSPNLLAGTNKGAYGWAEYFGVVVIDTVTVDIYETGEDVQATAFTNAGNAQAVFSREIQGIEADTQGELFTISFDFMSADTLGEGVTITYGAPQINSAYLSWSLTEDAYEYYQPDTWYHFSDTAECVVGPNSLDPRLFFFLTEDNQGITLANLKIELGAQETPWRPADGEAEEISNEAIELANEASSAAQDASDAAKQASDAVAEVAEHFFVDANGVHVSQIAGDASTGKNVLVTSNGLEVRDGTTPLGTFEGGSITLSGEEGDYLTLRQSTAPSASNLDGELSIATSVDNNETFIRTNSGALEIGSIYGAGLRLITQRGPLLTVGGPYYSELSIGSGGDVTYMLDTYDKATDTYTTGNAFRYSYNYDDTTGKADPLATFFGRVSASDPTESGDVVTLNYLANRVALCSQSITSQITLTGTTATAVAFNTAGASIGTGITYSGGLWTVNDARITAVRVITSVIANPADSASTYYCMFNIRKNGANQAPTNQTAYLSGGQRASWIETRILPATDGDTFQIFAQAGTANKVRLQLGSTVTIEGIYGGTA